MLFVRSRVRAWLKEPKKALARIRATGPKGIAALTELIGNHDPAIRLAAATVAGDFDDDAVIGALVPRVLGDPVENVKRAAADSLVAIGASAVPRLAREFQASGVHPYPMRELIGQLLVRIGTPSVAQAFFMALPYTDENPERRWILGLLKSLKEAAFDGLAEMLDPRAGDIFQRREVAKALVAIDYYPRTIDEKVRMWAIQSRWPELRSLGPAAVPALTDIVRALPHSRLAPDEIHFARDATEALVAMEGGGAGALCERLLNMPVMYPDPSNILTTLESLAAAGPPVNPQVVSALTHVLEQCSVSQGPEWDGVFGAACDAVARLRVDAPEVIARLASASREEEGTRRGYAIEALGVVGQRGQVENVKSGLLSVKGFVREDAAQALMALGWQPESTRDKVLYGVARQDWEGLVSLGDQAVDDLLPILTWDDQVLTRPMLGSPELVPYISDELYELRCRIAQVLCRIGSQRASPGLLGFREWLDEYEVLGEFGWGFPDSRLREETLSAIADYERKARSA